MKQVANIIKETVKRRQISVKKIYHYLYNEACYFLRLGERLKPPALLLLEPSGVCNLRCRLCKLGNNEINRPKGLMPIQSVEKIITEIGSSSIVVLFTNWGEPFLNSELNKMIKMVSDYNVYTKLNTNGHFTDDENTCIEIINSGLNEIVIAVDGVTPEAYLENRIGGDFDKVKSGISCLSITKKKMGKSNPIIKLLFIVTKKNENQINEVPSFAKKMGADSYVIKTANLAYLPENEKSDFDTENQKLSRYQHDMVLKEKMLDGCRRLWHSTVILWDGRVVPCCNDDEGEYTFGNINHESFIDIWNGEKYSSFRKNIMKNKNSIKMCRDCPGSLIWKSIKNESSTN